MTWTALVSSVSALAFTTLSFWWLHARPGRLRTWEPRSYVAAATGGDTEKLYLRLPLVLYNDGATPIVVEQLRVTIASNHAGEEGPSLSLQAIHRTLYNPDETREYPTGFSVPGRGTLERTFEFQRFEWSPTHRDESGEVSLTLYGKVFGERRRVRRWPDTRWVELLEFQLTDVDWSRAVPRDNRAADEPELSDTEHARPPS